MGRGDRGPGGKTGPTSPLAGFAIVAVSLLVALGAGEIGLRLLDKPGVWLSGWRSHRSPATEVNEMGYRGRSLDTDLAPGVAPGSGPGPGSAPGSAGRVPPTVLLVGDSHVESLALAYDRMPERRLEAHLQALDRPARVRTLGCSGYGQDQQLLALREYLAAKRPLDLVVIWLEPKNDVWNNVFPTHWPANGRPKPTFRLDGGELVGPHEEWGRPIRSSWKTVAIVQKVLTPPRDEAWERFLPPPYEPLATAPEEAAAEGRVDPTWQERWDADFAGFRFESLENEKSHLALYFVPPSARVEYGVELTAALLREIESEVEAAGARLVLFRAMRPEELATAEAPESVHPLNGGFYRGSQARFERNVAAFCADLDYRPIPIPIDDYRVGPEDGHLNDAATDETMAALARSLAGDGLPASTP